VNLDTALYIDGKEKTSDFYPHETTSSRFAFSTSCGLLRNGFLPHYRWAVIFPVLNSYLEKRLRLEQVLDSLRNRLLVEWPADDFHFHGVAGD
jgi:hypothetical protein